MGYRFTAAAEAQFEAILLRSARTHGTDAAARYSRLIVTAASAIGHDPGLPGSCGISRLPGIRFYPARLSRMRVRSDHRVGSPRHLILYRLAADGVVEILGLVHDRMVLSRAARKILRTTSEG
ncbi:MAG TPA: type II toxin-antitoxin system RelE/ParE family toxin [Roseomonas sp.]